MAIVALGENDLRLREVCAPLTKADLRLKVQQAEIDALLDFVYGKVNKRLRGVARDRNKPGTVGLSANQVGGDEADMRGGFVDWPARIF